VFEDEHVLVGDPNDPPEELEHGQLLWDGVEGGGGGGGSFDGDYLPLTGGTVTGDLTVTVNGLISGQLGPVPEDFWMPNEPIGRDGTVFNTRGMVGGSQDAWSQSMTSNGYRGWKGRWVSMLVGGNTGAAQIDLEPTGHFYVKAASDHPTGSLLHPPIQFMVSEAGPTFRAMPSETRTVDDVLERAETAEYPPEDDEGVATMDVHDEVPLFEVVSAMLAKIKELSARIETLEGS
jgi:hypothetical protein